MLLSVGAMAQEKGGSWAVKAGGDYLTIGSFRDTYTSLGFKSFLMEMDFATAPSGKGEDYAAAFNYPVFGIGINYNTLSDVKFRSKNGHYSDMLALYGTMSRDLLRTGWLGFGYNIHLGLSYSDGYYRVNGNSANWFFSSPVLFYAGAGGHLTFMVGPRLDIEADISVRHNSSARFAYPNGGLNYWGGGLSARYRFQGRRTPKGNVFSPSPISGDLFSKGWSLEIYGGGGVHACAAEWRAYQLSLTREELAKVHLKRWPMASFSVDAIYRAGGRFAFGLTADGFYSSVSDRLKWADGIIYSEEEAEASKGYSPLSAGVGIVQEVFYGNVALYVQEGLYLYRHAGIHGEHGPLYERAGFRYYPEKLSPVFIGACIKAHKFKADYLDLTIGLRLK